MKLISWFKRTFCTSSDIKLIRDYYDSLGLEGYNDPRMRSSYMTDKEVVESLIASHMRIRNVESQLSDFRQKVANYRGKITKTWLWKNIPL